jgi:hypothetical protein
MRRVNLLETVAQNEQLFSAKLTDRSDMCQMCIEMHRTFFGSRGSLRYVSRQSRPKAGCKQCDEQAHFDDSLLFLVNVTIANK